jgi:hypothetical protein
VNVEHLGDGKSVVGRVGGFVVFDGLSHGQRAQREQTEERQETDAHDEDRDEDLGQGRGGAKT